MENVSQVPDSQLHVFQAALSKQEQDQSFRGKYSIEGALLPNADLEVHSDVPVLRRVKLDISNDRNRSTRTLRPSLQHLATHETAHKNKHPFCKGSTRQGLTKPLGPKFEVLQVCSKSRERPFLVQ